MKERTLIRIAIVVLGLVALLLIWNSRRAPSTGEAEGERLLPSLSSVVNDIQRIEFTQGDATSVLERRGEAWVDTSRDDFPLQFVRIRVHLDSLSTIRTDEALTSDPDRHGALALSWPDEEGNARLVRLYVEDDTPVVELVLGREKWQPRSVYTRLLGEDQCWRCREQVPFESDTSRWMDRVVCTIATSDIQALTMGPLTLARSDPSETWSATQSEEEKWSEDKVQSARTTLPALLNRLEFEDVRAAGDGFEGDPDFAIFYVLDEGTVTLEGYRLEEATWFRLTGTLSPPEDEAVEEDVEEEDADSENVEDDAIPADTDEPPAWIAQSDEWTRWEYRLPSWRADQIETLLAPDPPNPLDATDPPDTPTEKVEPEAPAAVEPVEAPAAESTGD